MKHIRGADWKMDVENDDKGLNYDPRHLTARISHDRRDRPAQKVPVAKRTRSRGKAQAPANGTGVGDVP